MGKEPGFPRAGAVAIGFAGDRTAGALQWRVFCGDNLFGGSKMKQRVYALAAGAIIVTAALAALMPAVSSRGDSTPPSPPAVSGKTSCAQDAALCGARPGASSGHHIFAARAEIFRSGARVHLGFNHDEAERSFEQAAQIDPKMAMAYWGIALVLGPNYQPAGRPGTRGKRPMTQSHGRGRLSPALRRKSAT